MKPISVLVIIISIIFLGVGSTWAGIENHGYPKVANYFLDDLVNTPAKHLASWDLLILTLNRNQAHYLAKLDSLRFYNPDVVLLAYIQSCGALVTAGSLHPERTYRLFYEKINQEDWWLYDVHGQRIGVDPDGQGGFVVGLINVCADAPVDGNGDRFIDWFPGFVQDNILSTGKWDGVFLDILWETVSWYETWYEGHPIDSDKDGTIDDLEDLDQRWGDGLRILTSGLRDLIGDDYLISSNGNNRYYGAVNGSMREVFPHMHGDWEYNIADPEYGYQAMDNGFLGPTTNVINGVWEHYLDTVYEPHQNNEFRKVLSYDLASTLVFGDGYFSIDGGDYGHRKFWWLDVYEIDLGDPLSDHESVIATPGAQPSDPWGYLFRQRRFENGTAVVNATEVPQEIYFDGFCYNALGYNGDFYTYHYYMDEVELSPHTGGVYMSADMVPGAVDTVASAVAPGKPTLLEWDPVDGAGRYAIYRAGYDHFYPDKEKLLGTTMMPRFADQESGSDTLSYYKVTAISPQGFEGPYSSAVEVRRIGGDPGVSGHTDGEKITIRWPATPDYEYVITRSEDSGKRQHWRTAHKPVSSDDLTCILNDPTVEAGKPYRYEVYEVSPDGSNQKLVGSIELTVPPDPAVNVLGSEVWPNPSSAGFLFSLSGQGPARAEIYDTQGRLVRAIDDWNCSNGVGHWSGLSDQGIELPSGTYFYRVSCGQEESRGKVTLIR